MRSLYFLALLGALMLVLLGGCDSNSNDNGGGTSTPFVVQGSIETIGNDPLFSPTVVLLDEENNLVDTAFIDINGDFVFDNVNPGTFTVSVNSFIDSIPVQTISDQFVVNNANVQLPTIFVPVAGDIIGLNRPDLADLVVFPRNEEGLRVPATVQIEGVQGEFGGDLFPIVVSEVPVGDRNVVISSGLESEQRTNVPFELGTVTVLNVTFNLPASANVISGSVVDTFGSAVAGVPVSLFADSIVLAQTTTDANGRFTFSGVASGTYSLRVTQTANGIPVITDFGPISVVDNDVLSLRIIVPAV